MLFLEIKAHTVTAISDEPQKLTRFPCCRAIIELSAMRSMWRSVGKYKSKTDFSTFLFPVECYRKSEIRNNAIERSQSTILSTAINLLDHPFQNFARKKKNTGYKRKNSRQSNNEFEISEMMRNTHKLPQNYRLRCTVTCHRVEAKLIAFSLTCFIFASEHNFSRHIYRSNFFPTIDLLQLDFSTFIFLLPFCVKPELFHSIQLYLLSFCFQFRLFHLFPSHGF